MFSSTRAGSALHSPHAVPGASAPIGVSSTSTARLVHSQRSGLEAGFMSSSAESCFARAATTPIVANASTQPKNSRCSMAIAGTATLSGYGA